jgi:parvulin-like peptidyl-prolyl isomerase
VKRFVPILFLAVLVVALVAGCGGTSGPKSVPSDAAAVVGDTTITKAQLKQALGEVQATYKNRRQPFPKTSSPQYKALQDQLVGFLVQNAELEQKGKDLGVTVTPQEIKARIAQVKQQLFHGSDTQYRQALKQQGLTEQTYIEMSVRPELFGEKISKKVTSSVKISDAQVKAYYDAHGQYERRSVRHILVNSQSLANQLYKRLQGGAKFAALAKKYSKDPGSAPNGGKLEISRGQTVPQFDQVAFSLKTGQISKPVHSQFGWHIIQALAPIQKTPLSQVQQSIRQQLLQQARNTAMGKFLDNLKRDFCNGKIAYQVGYAPTTDPCAALTTSTATPATPTT